MAIIIECHFSFNYEEVQTLVELSYTSDKGLTVRRSGNGPTRYKISGQVEIHLK